MARFQAAPEADDAVYLEEFDGDIAAVAHELRVVIGQLLRRLRAEYTFPISHLTVLGQLDREGPSTTTSLAAFERVRPQSMAQTISELEAACLVTRYPDPSDGRQVLVALTHIGRETLATECSQRDTWLAQALAERFNPQEQAALVQAVPLLIRLTLP